VKILDTKADGEVDHNTVDKSLEGEEGYGTLSLNALSMANAKAIGELEERLKKLESEK
jgi:hypothetical protein